MSGPNDDDPRDPLAGLKGQLSGIRQSLHTVTAAPIAPDLRSPPPPGSSHPREADVVRSLDYKVTVLRGKRMGERFDIGRIITFGRADNCEVRLDEIAVSREHCRVVYHPEKKMFLLQDLGSQNGTKLNGKTVRRGELASGDRIGIGSAMVMFHLGPLPEDVRRELEERKASERDPSTGDIEVPDEEPMPDDEPALPSPLPLSEAEAELPTKTDVDPPMRQLVEDKTATEMTAIGDDDATGPDHKEAPGLDEAKSDDEEFEDDEDDWMDDGAFDEGDSPDEDDEDEQVETNPLAALDAAMVDGGGFEEHRPAEHLQTTEADARRFLEGDFGAGAVAAAADVSGADQNSDAVASAVAAAAAEAEPQDEIDQESSPEEDTDADVRAISDEELGEEDPAPDTERTITPRGDPMSSPDEPTGEVDILEEESGSVLIVAAFFLGGVAGAVLWWFFNSGG